MTKVHELKGTLETTNWGLIGGRDSVLHVDSGDVVKVESISHHAGNLPELMMDEGVKVLYDELPDRGPGKHIVTGPITVEGAKKGGVLKVSALDIEPRLPYGSNQLAAHGTLNEDFDKHALKLEKVLSNSFTNFDLSEVEAFADMLMTYKWNTDSFYELPGNEEVGSFHDRFIVDEEALIYLVRDLFYIEK